MALQKAIKQNSGYEATYWRIDRLQIDWRNRNANIRLAGYKDEQTRKDHPRSSVMDQRNYNITGNQFDQFFDIPDAENYPTWDSSTEYSKGEIVSFENGLYQANETIATDQDSPNQSSLWDLYGDLRVNRRIAYDYIKNNDIDFTDASSV